jgi:hypothetical protein
MLDAVEGGQMRCLALSFLLFALVVLVADAQESPDTDEPKKEVTLEEWCVGKSRIEVVEALGKPSKKKKRNGNRVFLYAWDGSPIQGWVFPGSGPYVTTPPLPIAASPQPSEVGEASGSKAPPVPDNWQELEEILDPEAEYEGARKSLAALEITFGDDDRVSSCRMVPRKHEKGAKKPKQE